MPPSSKTETGSLLRQHLAAAGATQSGLARSMGTSDKYVNFIATGHRKPGPEWVDLIATSLGLTPDQRAELHRAAARDHGFKIDLT